MSSNWTEKDLHDVYRRRGVETLAQKEAVAKSSRTGHGKREDLGGRRFRSTWEANIARYLNWLVSIEALDTWDYECDEWKFPIERGERFYLCDFKLQYVNRQTPEYWEVKGWMDSKSKTKLNRMNKYYPDVRIIVIGPTEYRNIAAQASGLPGWETGEFRVRARRRFES